MKRNVMAVVALFCLLADKKGLGQNSAVVTKYSYSTDYFFQSMTLFSSGSFEYLVSGHMNKFRCRGNWQILNDQLILDSSPQKDKIICFESRRGRGSRYRFYVRRKSDDMPIYYHLYVVNAALDTLEARDQFGDAVIINQKIKGFYLITTNGICSPFYEVKGGWTNVFKIWIETDRVFDNERWMIVTDGLVPKDTSGTLANYVLTKVKE